MWFSYPIVISSHPSTAPSVYVTGHDYYNIRLVYRNPPKHYRTTIILQIAVFY